MKGTKRVVLNIMESYQERKAWIWSTIDLNRDLIKTVQEVCSDDEPLKKQVLSNCRAEIRKKTQELSDLARWFKQSGLKETEPYNRRVNEGK